MHFINTNEVFNTFIATLKRETLFLTVIIPTCHFYGRYIELYGCNSHHIFSKRSA